MKPSSQARNLRANDLGTLSLEGLRHRTTPKAASPRGMAWSSCARHQQGPYPQPRHFRSKRRCPFLQCPANERMPSCNEHPAGGTLALQAVTSSPRYSWSRAIRRPGHSSAATGQVAERERETLQMAGDALICQVASTRI